MSVHPLQRIIGGAQRLRKRASSSLLSHGIDPTISSSPYSEPTVALTLVLPPPIDNDLVAVGYPLALSRQLSDTYISAAQNIRDSCNAELQTICTSLSSSVSQLTMSGWQSKMEGIVKARYTSKIRHLHHSTMENLRQNVKIVLGRDAVSIDRPFDHVSCS
jgi:hypothetical protein